MKVERLRLLGFGVLVVIGLMALYRCSGDSTEKPKVKTEKEEERLPISIPAFSGDSAYAFVQAQVDFGPRVPNSLAHEACGDYLVAKLREFGADVIEQKDNVTAFDGTSLKMRNIIGQFQPEKPQRLLLFAHWDTRPFADKDSTRVNEAIDGANDGGSGIGVLLEIARQLSMNPTPLGVDIIFFDSEDYGAPEGSMTEGDYRDWCLGSQYWAASPHRDGYAARFGILLDMVGAEGAVFPREGTSMYFAPRVVRKVWRSASELGHADMFINDVSGQTIDDHLFVNQIAAIPSIAIVHYHTDEEHNGYGHFHHTHDDNMDIISKETLQIVGDVVMDVIYRER